jgi:hypothetical protein
MAWECGSFEAWHDWMPGKPATMHVTGEVTFPTTGYTVSLRMHEPQGTDADDLLLDLVVEEPTGPVNEVVTVVPVEFAMETDYRYTTASVIDCAMGIPVKDLEVPEP